jgi:hypothetical protein
MGVLPMDAFLVPCASTLNPGLDPGGRPALPIWTEG